MGQGGDEGGWEGQQPAPQPAPLASNPGPAASHVFICLNAKPHTRLHTHISARSGNLIPSSEVLGLHLSLRTCPSQAPGH